MIFDALVCTVGTSGPVVTETVAYLKKIDKRLQEVHMITTSDEAVKQNATLVETALRNRFGKEIDIKNHVMFEKDIENYANLISFMRICKQVIVQIRESYPKAKIGVLISGGRKTESVAASFVAMGMGIDAVLHVYSSIVTPYNIGLERAKALIEELYTSEDKGEFYIENKTIFDEICFPPFETYEVIGFLVPPVPRDYMQKLVVVFKACPASKSRLLEYIDEQELDECEEKGLLYLHDTMYALTDKGRDFLKVFGD